MIFHKTWIYRDKYNNIQWSKIIKNISASTFNMLIGEITLDNYYLDYYAPQTSMGHRHRTGQGPVESLI